MQRSHAALAALAIVAVAVVARPPEPPPPTPSPSAVLVQPTPEPIAQITLAPTTQPTPTRTQSPTQEPTPESTPTPEPTSDQLAKFVEFGLHVGENDIGTALGESAETLDYDKLLEIALAEGRWLVTHPATPCYEDLHASWFLGVTAIGAAANSANEGKEKLAIDLLNEGGRYMKEATDLIAQTGADCGV